LNLTAGSPAITISPGNVKLFPTALQRFQIVGIDADNSVDVDMREGETESAYVGTAAFLDEGDGQLRIAGVIGLPALSHATVRLDFVRKTLTYFPEPHPPLKTAGGTNILLKKQDDAYYAGVLLNGRIPVDLLLDTGADAICISDTLTPRLFTLATASSLQGNIAGWVDATNLLLPNLKLGELVEPRVWVAAVRYDAPNVDSILGLDLLSRFRVTIDFRNGMLTLERRADYLQAVRPKGKTDIALKRGIDNYSVAEIARDSPAWGAGLRTGDRLIRVDGHALSALPFSIAQRLLDGFAGSRAAVIRERAGRQARVSYTRRSGLEARKPVGIGISVTRTEEGKWQVAAIAPGSPAEKAGLQEEDELLELDGLSARKMSAAQMATYAKRRLRVDRTLKVRRKGEEKPRKVCLRAPKQP
jgi:membrane-associated protease RseP (regulator of RpoE activity)